jgi:tetratricopeptide (TPR) repeat protein
MVERDCQKISIVGLGGTGKTQVALQFAYMVKEKWPEFSVFWLPALSVETFEQACTSVAKALRIPQAANQEKEEDVKELVKQHLSSTQAGQWLLIIDNADDPDILFGTGQQAKGIADYLPESETGMTVYTTRIQEVATSLTRSNVMEVGPMDPSDASSFLEKSLIRKDLLRNITTTNDLLNELACLPLAIAQAAAYLNINKTMSIKTYLRLLRNTEQGIVSLMSKEFRDDTRYKDSVNAVATTWVVSFTQLRERDAAAADLLAFISCIEWKAIPRSLLPRIQSETQMEEALSRLCGYSFLARREEDNQKYLEDDGEEVEEAEQWYDMHRLVHVATRIWTNKHGNSGTTAEKAVEHVVEVFPTSKYENQEVWRAYLPHALHLLENPRGCSVEKRSELCLLVGGCLEKDGRTREAVKWLEQCCWLRSELDETDSDRLSAEHALAGAYHEDGQVQKALELMEHVVTVKGKILAEEHLSRLASQHSLARIYQADGQVQKALELMEHIVTVKGKMLAEEHPSRLASQHVLAIVYNEDGQVQKALELMEHIVTIEGKILAEEHPDRLASQHVLARVYQADGQVQKALELMEHIVTLEGKMLAEEHPSRLASQHVLARVYQADGQVQKAIELMEHVVTVEGKILVEEHPDRLASQYVLARVYQAEGQVQKAIELMEHVVAVEARVLRDGHPDRQLSIEALENMYAQLRDDKDST